jgi:flagellar export protein FliJ
MAKYRFKLEKLLEYRHLQEKWAKDEFLSRRAKKLEGEKQIELIKERRTEAAGRNYQTLEERRAQEAYVARLEDEKRGFEAAVAVLTGEEEVARVKWLNVKKDAEALEKLKQKDFELWTTEEQRRVQNELDEWSIQRRAS